MNGLPQFGNIKFREIGEVYSSATSNNKNDVSALEPGDSGGALFRENIDGRYELVGIGFERVVKKKETISLITKLQNPKIMEWLISNYEKLSSMNLQWSNVPPKSSTNISNHNDILESAKTLPMRPDVKVLELETSFQTDGFSKIVSFEVPAISPESVLGGIAISSADINTPTLCAMNLAHELGHYLGLYHVKENGRLLFDPIPDTDPDSTEVNIMDAVGSNNPDGPLRFFTPQQTEVISRSPSIIYEKTNNE